MKFPVVEHPFPPVRLTPEQCHEYERVTTAMLEEAVEEYNRFVHVENRKLDKKKWKAVKSRENLTVYKQVEREFGSLLPTHASAKMNSASRTGMDDATAYAASTVVTNVHEWRLPRLLGVGTIAGMLDDVMYGFITTDLKSTLLRASYLKDEIVDGRVLNQIKGPTPEDPFRFLGIKWVVKAHMSGINTVVLPRDCLMILSTGMHTAPNGDRFGYHVMQSVELPECPELKSLSMRRGGMSSCYLFKQAKNGSVEVFLKSYAEPGGHMPDSVATLSISNSLIGCWKSVWCAQGKKIMWMIKKRAAERLERRRRGLKTGEEEAKTSKGKKYSCGLCRDSFRAFRSTNCCDICMRLVCSRCHMSRKVHFIQRGYEVKDVSVMVCKTCTIESTQLDAFELAREEAFRNNGSPNADVYIEEEDWMINSNGPVDPSSRSSDSSSSDVAVTDLLQGFTSSVSSYGTSVSSTGSLSYGTSVSSSRRPSDPVTLLERSSNTRSMSVDSDYFQGMEPQSISPINSIASPRWDAPTVEEPQSEEEYRKHLWMQMQQLRLAAEHTYMITKQTASVMGSSPPSRSGF
ncbi:hypothetical protein Poli38472_007322 [Pythium oligandrum]|uniref:FYVE-type domain-containing protein n=1 Tax=Pythium oligandrum TaxID=41045 RepID=A0A8K1FGX9_PYTOL|nr:hypothetical protein Poli38472_007322 [Pythium oligandrum]|eukprot:TMW59177.1 hypothetical protein Poli38472_007322 [Pythium oligandrum]